MTKIGVIGSGFSSLSAACHLANAGYEVSVFEKNSTPGGRARRFISDGFTFDMGPSWYWMPGVFERFFAQFGKRPSDYYDLIRLDPSYRVKFREKSVDIPASMLELEQLFESIEPGSSKSLRRFLDQAAYKYNVGVNRLVYKPSRNLSELIDWQLMSGLFKMDVFTSMSRHVRKYFKNEKLIQLMEFPVLFLGSTPQETPALYSLMNYADMSLGTWYPMGGMHEVVRAMMKLAIDLGVQFHFDHEVEGFNIKGNSIKGIVSSEGEHQVDVVVGGADYHHIEQHLLPEHLRKYSAKYWNGRTMAPSSLLFYIGLDRKLPNMEHHVLFFDEDFGKHAHEIYKDPKWPSKPLLYASVTSKTDPSVAPTGHENLVVLIPVAPGLIDADNIRQHYYKMTMKKLSAHCGFQVDKHVVFSRSYAHNDFIKDYHSFKGNAYGLANTLMQTAFLKPKMKSDKVQNLFYAGQLTVPGPGVPPSIISGEVVSKEIQKDFKITSKMALS